MEISLPRRMEWDDEDKLKRLEYNFMANRISTEKYANEIADMVSNNIRENISYASDYGTVVYLPSNNCEEALVKYEMDSGECTVYRAKDENNIILIELEIHKEDLYSSDLEDNEDFEKLPNQMIPVLVEYNLKKQMSDGHYCRAIKYEPVRVLLKDIHSKYTIESCDSGLLDNLTENDVHEYNIILESCAYIKTYAELCELIKVLYAETLSFESYMITSYALPMVAYSIAHEFINDWAFYSFTVYVGDDIYKQAINEWKNDAHTISMYKKFISSVKGIDPKERESIVGFMLFKEFTDNKKY